MPAPRTLTGPNPSSYVCQTGRGHVTETIGHDPEIGGHEGPKYSAGRLVRVLPEYRQDLDGAWIVYPCRRHISEAARTPAEFVAAKLTPRLSE